MKSKLIDHRLNLKRNTIIEVTYGQTHKREKERESHDRRQMEKYFY